MGETDATVPKEDVATVQVAPVANVPDAEGGRKRSRKHRNRRGARSKSKCSRRNSRSKSKRSRRNSRSKTGREGEGGGWEWNEWNDIWSVPRRLRKTPAEDKNVVKQIFDDAATQILNDVSDNYDKKTIRQLEEKYKGARPSVIYDEFLKIGDNSYVYPKLDVYLDQANAMNPARVGVGL